MGMLGLNFNGAYVTLDNLRVTLINPYRNPDYKDFYTGLGSKFGWQPGVSISGHHVNVVNCEFDHLPLGVNLTNSSNNCQIINNYAHDMDGIWYLGGSPGIMGALGFMLHGTDNSVTRNRYENSGVDCYLPNGVLANYSGIVEIYNAILCQFTHNISIGYHRKHAEIGKSLDKICRDNIYSFNLLISDHPNAVGVNIHGNDAFGPCTGTIVEGNTAYFPGVNSQGIVSGYAGATVRNNIFWARGKSGYFRTPLTESHNIFWGSRPQFTSGTFATTSRYLDPMLDENGQPLPGSPALTLGPNGTPIGYYQESDMSIKISEIEALLLKAQNRLTAATIQAGELDSLLVLANKVQADAASGYGENQALVDELKILLDKVRAADLAADSLIEP